jgi:L-asparaginase II
MSEKTHPASAPTTAPLVEVWRGPLVESRHRGHVAAVDGTGRLLAHLGEPDTVTFMRSSAKPLQALPLVRAVGGLDETEIAIASASHLADADQLAAVRRLLARAEAGEDELECGEVDGSRLNHNCSGKHAGMLLLARTRGWPTGGYRLAGHPVQDGALAEVAAATEVPADDIPTAVDGCGVLTFGLPLERMAFAFSRLERIDAGDRVAAAMRAKPELIRGEQAADTMLMRALPGWAAKGGAEGLLCAAGPDGTGVALKVEDGGQRALKPALAAFLDTLGYGLEGFDHVPVLNSRGEKCGEVVAHK